MITRRSAAQPVSASRAKEEEAGPRLGGRGDGEGLEGRAFDLNRWRWWNARCASAANL